MQQQTLFSDLIDKGFSQGSCSTPLIWLPSVPHLSPANMHTSLSTACFFACLLPPNSSMWLPLNLFLMLALHLDVLRGALRRVFMDPYKGEKA